MCSSIHPIISTLLQDLKLTKHWFSSFQWVPLQEGMNEICATFRPPITIFLMAGALTKRTIGPENAHLKPDLGVLSHNEMTLTLNTHIPLLTS